MMTFRRPCEGLYLALVPLLFALPACDETIEIGELEPRIVALGPIEVVDDAAHVYYALNDEAGNDQALTVEICKTSGTDNVTDCAPVARSAPESDGTESLSTLPPGTDVIHLFAWYLGCGTIVDNEVDGEQNA